MRGLHCIIWGHNFSTIKKENILIKEFVCESCKQKFTTDGYGKLVKLSSYWKQNNIFFEKHSQKV